MINFRKTADLIVGVVDGVPFNLPNTAEALAAIGQFQADMAGKKEVLDYVAGLHKHEVAGSNKYLTYVPMTKEYFLELDGKRSKHAIPKNLVTYIEDSYDKDIDFLPVLKAWARLLVNPRYTPTMGSYFNTYIGTKFLDQKQMEDLMENQKYSHDVARELATYNDIAITEEGLLATYKVAEIVTWEYTMELNDDTGEWERKKVKKEQIAPVVDPTTGKVITPAAHKKEKYAEDNLYTPYICKYGDLFYSGQVLGYVYKIGEMQYLPKDAKRNLRNTTGGGGLYSGGLHYIDGFHTEGVTEVLTCLVNPSDLISFQHEGHAFRTDALFPYNVWDEDVQLRSTYHSADYDKLSTERVEALIAEAIAEDRDILLDQMSDSN